MTRHTSLAKFTYLWAPVFFYMALIFFMSSLSFSWTVPAQKMHGDWVVHVVEYTLFGLLLTRALGHFDLFWHSKARLFTAVMVLGLAYGALDEFHQAFVPGRDSSVMDFLADAVGVFLGCWIWFKKQEVAE